MASFIHHYDSPLGGITVSGDGTAITGLWFDGQKYYAEGLSKDAEERPLPVFEEADRWLSCYFSGKDPGFPPPFKTSGTPFREAVWEILREIPYGQSVTYGEIAKTLEERFGRRVSAQAVGGAVGHNPIALMIPCHRVLGAGGKLTGYAGGVEKKAWLLSMEGCTFGKDQA